MDRRPEPTSKPKSARGRLWQPSCGLLVYIELRSLISFLDCVIPTSMYKRTFSKMSFSLSMKSVAAIPSSKTLRVLYRPVESPTMSHELTPTEYSRNSIASKLLQVRRVATCMQKFEQSVGSEEVGKG